MFLRFRLLLLASTLCAGLPAVAQVALGPVEFHGYGDFTALHTSHEDDGWGREHDVSLVAHLPLSQSVELWVQGAHSSETDAVKLDWAFLDWSMNPVTSLRLGQIKLPFGLINEVRDVQALRLSASMPHVYSDELQIIDEAVRGMALERRVDRDSGAALTLELYAALQMLPDAGEVRDSRVVGARAAWSPAGDGWNYSFSGYFGKQDSDADTSGAVRRQNKRAAALSVERAWGRWTMKGEVARASIGDINFIPVYLQLDHRSSARWGAFARAETTRLRGTGDAERLSRFAAGAAWMATSHLGARLEVAHNTGTHRHVTGSARENWTDVHVSVNFVF